MNFSPGYRLIRNDVSLSLILALPLLLSLSGCRSAATADDADKPVVAVQAEHPTIGPITEDIVSDAILSPLAQAAIQSKVTAPIKAFYVQRGSKVKAGQLLATLENQDLAAAALDNKGSYTAAQGAYTTATRQQVPQEETQAELDVEQAKATLDLDQSILNARSQLLAQGAIPGRDVDTAKATVLQAQATYQIAKQKFDSIRSVGKTASLQTAEGQLSSAKGKYLGAEAQLGYTSIRTPIAGVVTERPLFAGETATAGAAIVTVMDTSVLIAKLHLAQRQAQQFAIGGEATLLVPGLDEPVKAKVSLISPALDPGSTTVEVWLRVDNHDGQLKAGSTVHATIKGHSIPKALLIPAEAVQRSSESGGKIVMVITADGTAHKKNITVGVATSDTVQVTDGLSVSDYVITTGGYGLDDGTKVKVEAATAKTDAGEKE
jgi:HlyD family secretion protein